VGAQQTAAAIIAASWFSTSLYLAKAIPEKPDLLLNSLWPAYVLTVQAASLPQPGARKR
jgi:hypothetical protein